jgi:hypothetical protein
MRQIRSIVKSRRVSLPGGSSDLAPELYPMSFRDFEGRFLHPGTNPATQLLPTRGSLPFKIHEIEPDSFAPDLWGIRDSPRNPSLRMSIRQMDRSIDPGLLESQTQSTEGPHIDENHHQDDDSSPRTASPRVEDLEAQNRHPQRDQEDGDPCGWNPEPFLHKNAQSEEGRYLEQRRPA